MLRLYCRANSGGCDSSVPLYYRTVSPDTLLKITKYQVLTDTEPYDLYVDRPQEPYAYSNKHNKCT